METQSPTPASSEYAHRDAAAKAAGFEPYYGHRFPETDGDVTVMDWVSPYPPEFFKTEHCLITRACQPPKVYRPCTDVLPRTMAWLAAGVPTDFIDRADARMARSSWSRSNLGDYGFTQVPDPGE